MGEQLLETMKSLDVIKNQKIDEHPEDVNHFVRFNYKENITKEYVVSKLTKYEVI